jgi:hypothetical protein
MSHWENGRQRIVWFVIGHILTAMPSEPSQGPSWKPQPFTVAWVDGTTGVVESNSTKFERLDGRWWWFFKFQKAIVAAKFAFDIVEILPKDAAERYPILVEAVIEWAGRHKSGDATSDLTLTAYLDDDQIRLD